MIMVVVCEADRVELSRREIGEIKRKQVKIESQGLNEGRLAEGQLRRLSPDCPAMHIWGYFTGQMCS